MRLCIAHASLMHRIKAMHSRLNLSCKTGEIFLYSPQQTSTGQISGNLFIVQQMTFCYSRSIISNLLNLTFQIIAAYI
jgi:hypothetical protein